MGIIKFKKIRNHEFNKIESIVEWIKKRLKTLSHQMQKKARYYQAVKRVKKIKGFYTHAVVYLVINIMIVIINIQNLKDGESYFQAHNFFTAFFWGLGLFAHGLSVFFA